RVGGRGGEAVGGVGERCRSRGQHTSCSRDGSSDVYAAVVEDLDGGAGLRRDRQRRRGVVRQVVSARAGIVGKAGDHRRRRVGVRSEERRVGRGSGGVGGRGGGRGGEGVGGVGEGRRGEGDG